MKNVQLFCGDCLEILPTIGKIDAIVTDPPYGIGADVGQAKRAGKQHGNAWAASKDYGDSDWDSKPCPPQTITQIRKISQHQIIFGGNYFDLPPSRCWLIWDKLNGTNDYADGEMVWTNFDHAVRIIRYRWHGMLRDGDDERVHPTQKPLAVMKWCLSFLPKGCSVCDPFMGSGTTGVAAQQTGHPFIGIEKDPKYFALAKQRIERAKYQETFGI